MSSAGIYWITPIVVDGVIRWPACDSEVVSEQTRHYRRGEDEDMDCLLTARVNYRGKKLCKRHAAIALLAEFVEQPPIINGSGE